jgi:hypothetical protein
VAYDAYLELERALQRMSTIEFDRQGELPGPLYDLADDLETVVGPEEAGRLAGFLNDKLDGWSGAPGVDEWEGQR